MHQGGKRPFLQSTKTSIYSRSREGLKSSREVDEHNICSSVHDKPTVKRSGNTLYKTLNPSNHALGFASARLEEQKNIDARWFITCSAESERKDARGINAIVYEVRNPRNHCLCLATACPG